MDMPDFRTAQEKEISRLQNCVTKLEFSKEFLEKDIERLRARVAELEEAILNAYYEGHEDAHGRYSESSGWATDCAIDWRNSNARQAIDAAREGEVSTEQKFTRIKALDPIAVKIMAALCANPDDKGDAMDKARFAYKAADALLAARKELLK